MSTSFGWEGRGIFEIDHSELRHCYVIVTALFVCVCHTKYKITYLLTYLWTMRRYKFKLNSKQWPMRKSRCFTNLKIHFLQFVENHDFPEFKKKLLKFTFYNYAFTPVMKLTASFQTMQFASSCFFSIKLPFCPFMTHCIEFVLDLPQLTYLFMKWRQKDADSRDGVVA